MARWPDPQTSAQLQLTRTRMEALYWDGAFAIARRLRATHPEADLSQVTLNMLYNWVVALPDFQDDPLLANDDLLAAIHQEWYEETQPL